MALLVPKNGPKQGVFWYRMRQGGNRGTETRTTTQRNKGRDWSRSKFFGVGNEIGHLIPSREAPARQMQSHPWVSGEFVQFIVEFWNRHYQAVEFFKSEASRKTTAPKPCLVAQKRAMRYRSGRNTRDTGICILELDGDEGTRL